MDSRRSGCEGSREPVGGLGGCGCSWMVLAFTVRWMMPEGGGPICEGAGTFQGSC